MGKGLEKLIENINKATELVLLRSFEEWHEGYYLVDGFSSCNSERIKPEYVLTTWVKPEHVSIIMKRLSDKNKATILENFEIDEEKNTIKRKIRP